MPLGETIGTAYVRVLADGTGFGEDAKRQMREHDGTFTKLGHEHGRAYQQGFAEESTKSIGHNMDDLRRIIQRGAGRFNATGEFIGSELMDGIREELEKRFGEVGTMIFHNLREELESGQIDFKGLVRKLRDIRPEFARAVKDVAGEAANNWRILGDAIEQLSKTSEAGAPSRRRLIAYLREMERILPDVVTDTSEFRDRMAQLRALLGSATPRFAKWREQVSKFGNTIGRFFGKGSRNDFVNFFGSLMGGIGSATRALTSFNKWPGLVAEQIQRLAAKFQNAIDDAGGFGRALLNLAAQGTPGLVAAVSAVAVLVNTLVALMGVAASAVSLLTGAILALAGSLAFALVGALVAVGGALVPLAAGITTVSLAIGGLNKKTAAFKALKKEWTDLQKQLAEDVFGKNGKRLSVFTGLLKTARPVFEAVGKAVGGLIDEFGKFTKTKGFQDMITNISKALGPMVTTLGHVAGNIGLFLGEAFLAAEPYINRFLGWLDKVTKALADTGKKGKNGKSPLSEFFSDAWDSAMAVWGVIKSLSGVIGTLFSAGKGHGDNIFKGISGELDKLQKWLKDPKNQKQIQQWFQDAEYFAGKLGTAIEAVGKFIAKLDTPTNRAILDFILDCFTKGVGFLGDMSLKLDEVNGKLGEFAQGWKQAGQEIDNLPTGKRIAEGGPIEALQIALDKLGPKLRGIWDSIPNDPGSKVFPEAFRRIKQQLSEGFSNLGSPDSAIGQLWTKIGTSFSNGWSSINTWWQTTVVPSWNRMWTSLSEGFGNIDLGQTFSDAFHSLPQGLQGALTQIGTFLASIPGKAATTASQITGAFGGLAQKIITKAGSISSAIGGWFASLPGQARTIATQVAAAFSGLAQKIITRAGSIASAVGSWFASLPGKARTIANQIASAFSGLAKKAIDKAGSLASAIADWASGAVAAAKRIAGQIAQAFVDALTGILGRISLGSLNLPAAARKLIPGLASGGIVLGPSIRQLGEAGPEAVVPLNRPLNMVDPAVRQLSAIAQGKSSQIEVTGRGGKTIDVGGITVITPTEDPVAVASEVIARMATAAYI